MNTIEQTRAATTPKAHRRYYLLDAEYSASHIAAYNAAKTAALESRDALQAKYKCTGILLRGPCGVALTYNEAFLHKVELEGCKSVRQKGGGHEVTPLKNTKRGKAVQAELDHCAALQDVWQWALEESLGVYASVFGYLPEKGFHHTVASILTDGRVSLSVPNDAKATNLVPDYAVELELTQVEWLELEKGRVQ